MRVDHTNRTGVPILNHSPRASQRQSSRHIGL